MYKNGRVGVLWRPSREGNEEVLEPRNLGYGVIPSYRKRPIPLESIGSSRRGCKNQMGGTTRWQRRVFEWVWQVLSWSGEKRVQIRIVFSLPRDGSP